MLNVAVKKRPVHRHPEAWESTFEVCDSFKSARSKAEEAAALKKAKTYGERLTPHRQGIGRGGCRASCFAGSFEKVQTIWSTQEEE